MLSYAQETALQIKHGQETHIPIATVRRVQEIQSLLRCMPVYPKRYRRVRQCLIAQIKRLLENSPVTERGERVIQIVTESLRSKHHEVA